LLRAKEDGWEKGMIAKKSIFCGNRNVLKLIIVMITQFCEHTTGH
jgi:hypothetical protein